jgi:hypothetical protein
VVGRVSSSVCLAAAIAGCGVTPEPLRSAGQPIQGGYEDTADTAVVGIVMNEAGVGICSGSLIAENLVLTARHCVSKIENEVTGGGVSCAKTTFAPTFSPDSFRVTTGDVAFLGSKYVQEVIGVPGDDPILCGQDVALLILLENVPADEAVPLLPRVDSPIAEGDVYSAVGFGAIDDAGDGSGTRRRLDDLVVSCVGEQCPQTITRPAEWIGDHGVCPGDSGGPALDAAGRVVGVTSRGPPGCEDPVYGSVFTWGEWIKESALHAADLGGYDVPPWATGHPTDPEFNYPVGDPCHAGTDCASTQCLDQYCTRACTDVAGCPEGYACSPSRGNVCTRIEAKAGPPKEDSSCALTASPASGSGRLGALALALAFAALLCRRHSGP